MYDLINIFETFLPQLLLYPNPTDPLNGEAARLLLKDTEEYNQKVKEFVKIYAFENITFKEKNDNDSENHDVNSKDKKRESESEASELSNASVSEIEDN